MPKRLDNIDFVKELMTRSKYGPLAQIFVIECLDKWSGIVAAEDPKQFDNALISGEAWVAVAKEINQKLAERMS